MKITSKLTMWQEFIILMSLQAAWIGLVTVIRFKIGLGHSLPAMLLQLLGGIVLAFLTLRFFNWWNRCANDYICEQSMLRKSKS